MFKKRMWLGIILSVILIIFSIDGFALYYKYTQESGANFYVSIADKADALENHNEIRQILDDLGNLLVHSKRDGSYPEDETTGGTLSIPNSALALLSAGAKGDILYCSAANVWSKLTIGADNKVLVVSTDVPNWETLSSDLLSDVAFIAMLDENEVITGAWTISTGSIAGIDATEFGYLNGISSFGGSLIDDANASAARTTLGLVIGTDVLAQQTIGIADDNLLEIDDADATIDDYCKLTANGVVGRSYSEVKTDLGIDLSLYYLKTQVDTQGEVEIIWGVTLATDSELGALTYSDVGAEQADAGLTSLAGLTYVSPSFIKVTATDTYVIRTIAEVKTDLSLNNVENTALSTWAGTESITTLGTITTGIWSGTALVIEKLPTAVVSDGDTTHVPTSDNVYDFCETTQNYALNSELHNEVTLGTASGLSLNVQELSLTINSDTSAGAVTSGSGQNQKVWKTDAAGVPGWRPDEGGVEASTFVALSDTPTFYTDQAHKFPRVNAAEDGMEFYTMPGGGDVLGPATSADNSIVRFDGTDSKTIQDSLVIIDDVGSINVPLGQKYKVNDVNLSYVDVGAIEDAADTVVSSHIDWGSGADQIDTDDVPEGSVNFYQLTGEEVDDYVALLINDGDSVHTLITITYDDPNNAYDFVVTNDLHEYDWTNVVAGDIPDLSAVYQPLDTALTNISALVYVSSSFIKLTANDTYAVRTLTEVKTDLSLNNVENTALSTWTGTESITTLGTIATGTWQGTAIADAYIPNTITINLSALSTTLTITDNEATNENNAILFTSGGAGSGDLGIEADGGDFYYNPSTGTLSVPVLNLTTVLAIAEGGTNFGAVLANDLVMISNAGAIVEGVVTVTELGRLDGLGGIIVTDVTECTDLEGTALSIVAGVLNVTEADPTVDEDSELKAILVDEVTKTGDFTAGRMAVINNASGIIQQGTNTDTDVADAVTKKHAANADTDLDGTFEATFVKKADTVNVLSDITSAGADIEDAVTKRHTQNTDTEFDFYNALGSDHTWSGDKDTQLVGENVVFGDILYKDWTTGEWMKAQADVFATTPGLRIALETKGDGDTCLMLVKGYIRDESAFDFGASRIYLNDDVAGTCDDTAPAESGDQIQMIGIAISADILWFDPSIDVGEI